MELAGFGAAAQPEDGDYSPVAHARRLAALLSVLDGGPPVLVGHSLGGAIILLAALMRQDAGASPPAGIVVVSGAVFPQRIPPFISAARIPGLRSLFLLGAPPRWALKAGLRTIVHDRATVTDAQAEGYLASLRSVERRRGILKAARQLDPSQGEEWPRRYPELHSPTLLLWGKKDRVVKPAVGERLHALLPNSRFVALEGVGHLPPEEAPAASLEPVLRFIEGLSAEG